MFMTQQTPLLEPLWWLPLAMPTFTEAVHSLWSFTFLFFPFDDGMQQKLICMLYKSE